MEMKPFEFRIGEREMSVSLGRVACVLFRTQQEVDYLAVNTSQEGDEESTVLRIFNNVDLVRWMAGFSLHKDGQGLTTDDGHTFREEYGWNPATVVKNAPNDDEMEWFLDVNARNLESEWERGL